jgi:hypothetical protein
LTQPVHPSRKLGLRPNDPAKPRLQLARMVRAVPEHPIAADLMDGVGLGLDMNDEFGTCVPTGFDNFRRMVTQALTGAATVASIQDITTWYRTQNPGFNPTLRWDDPRQQDDGMVIQDFLAWLTRQGLILGFAAVDVRDDEMLKAANYLAMGPINGLDLDQVQVGGQFDAGTWDYDPTAPNAGGHCVPTGAYSGDDRAEEDCATWAARIHMTADFLDRQRSEAWAVLLPEHVQHPGFREHFDLAAFAAAYTAITGRAFPVKVDPDVPVPPAPQPAGRWVHLSPAVAGRVDRAAHRRGLLAEDWVNDHFQHYFRDL